MPRNGNLLLDFKFNNYRTPEEAVLFRSNTGNAGGLYSSMHDFGPLNVRARNSSDGFIGNGLVTTFDTAAIGPVPEPGTWAMMILGFGVIGSAMRSARRKQTMRIRFA